MGSQALLRGVASFVLLLTGVAACDAPISNEKPAVSAKDTPKDTLAEAGASSVTFSSPKSWGEKIITLTRDGTVKIGADTVGRLEGGKLTVDGVEVGSKSDTKFEIYSMAGASFEFDEAGSMRAGTAQTTYLGWAEDGAAHGGLVDETAGFKAHFSGGPQMRDEMTFLFMALTVAKGPALANKVAPAVVDRTGATTGERGR